MKTYFNSNPGSEYLHHHTARAFGPLVQATITGALIALIVLVMSIWERVRDGYFYALLTWLIVTTITWLILQRHWFTLTGIERATGMDIDQDGYIGEEPEDDEPPARHSVIVDIHQKREGGFDQVDTATLPFTAADMEALAAGLQAGKPFTEREWTGSGKPLSVKQFREARAEMLKRGMLEPTNPKAPQQGYKLTRAGMAVMRHFSPPAPTI